MSTTGLPLTQTCFTLTGRLPLCLVLWALAFGAPAQAGNQTWLSFKITPQDEKAAILAEKTLWLEASSSIKALFQGGEVTVPMSRIRRAVFLWEQDAGAATLTLPDNQTLQVKIQNPKTTLSAVLRGLPVEVQATFPLSTIHSLEVLTVPPVPPAPPAPGMRLVGKAGKDSDEPATLLLGDVDENGIYANSYGTAGSRARTPTTTRDPSALQRMRETSLSRGNALTLTVGGISVKCPFGAVKSATAKDGQLEINLQDGTLLRGEGTPFTIKGKLMDMDATVEKWTKAEFSWQPKEAPLPQPTPEQPQPGSVLIAVFTKDGATLPELVVAKMVEIRDRPQCQGIESSAEPTFGLSTAAGVVTCPFSKIRSITVQADETTVVLNDGSTLVGTSKATKVTGLMEGQKATVENWSHVEFSWRPQGSAGPAGDTAAAVRDTSWDQRYYQIPDLSGRSFVVETFLNNLADTQKVSLVADFKGADLSVEKGCRSWIFGTVGASAVLANGEKVRLTGKLPDYMSLWTEYAPSIPARVVISTGDIREMVSGEDAGKSTLKEDWEQLGRETPKVAWSVTDLQGRSYVVVNLRGYQHGMGYNSPPAGYYWIGGGPHREAALVGGGCAILDMGKASAHIPLACIESIDAVKGLAALKAANAAPPERLRGFCDDRPQRSDTVEDIDGYLRLKEREWQDSTLVGDSLSGNLAIPIVRCSSIVQTVMPNDFTTPAADETARTIKVQTSDGTLVLNECLISYKCPFSTSKAPYLLVLGKDESSDDPDEYKVAQLAVDIPDGPTVLVPLRIVLSAAKKGDLVEVNLVDGRQILGTLPEGTLLGTGVLGQTSVDLGKVEKLEIQR
ncbi:MAG: hypothetical protein A2Y77_00520 [Planctomycetes bacterium RBG_13_62_9]|nr:MAG: hypothetical protein A2Y77_00520 [Planctomycetes bacterium RBG_13_62_9]